MKKSTFLIFLLILLFTKSLNAQSAPVTNPENEYIPNSTPPSPEDFKFTKVGEIPVNESTGNATVNIPLYTFTAGKISVPISLFHSGGAVLVDEDNSWTGINWQLDAGGLITRTVNDRPDEKMSPNQRLHPEGSISEQTFYSMAISSLDSEVDIFNYNFNGYSGSFYFDTSFVARHIKYDHELKIEMLPNTDNKSTIIITDMEGTRYYFGGNDASESTKIRTGAVDMNEEYQTSFHLYKITNLSGDIVEFKYDPDGFASMRKLAIQQELIQDISIDGQSECSPFVNNNSSLVTLPQTYIQSSGKMILKTISSNRSDFHRVELNSERNTSPSINRTFLKDIVVHNQKDQTLKRIDLDYIYPDNISGNEFKRFFLSTVTISYGTASDEVYLIDYNNVDQLPERFSFSQDYAGYFNGKPNTNYIPSIPNMQNVFATPQLTLADRSVDFEKTCHGSLKRITYPTKGFTQFDYETEPDGILGYVPGPSRFLNVRYNKLEPASFNQFISTTSFLPTLQGENGSNPPSGDDTGNSTTLHSPLNTSQPVKVTVTVNITGPNLQQNYIKLTLDDLDSTNDTVRTVILPSNSDSTTQSLTFNYTFTDLNILGNYTFKLEYYCTTEGAYPTNLTANAQISYSSHTPILGFRPGIRVKRVLDYPSESELPLVKRFYYNTAAKRNQSDSQISVRQPRFFGNETVTGCCIIESVAEYFPYGYPYTVYKTKLYSQTQNNIYISDYNRNLYQYVTVSYGGDNFENGGKQSKFFIQADLPMSPITYNDNSVAESKSSNNSLKNGTLLNEIYFNADATFDIETDEIIVGKVKEIIYDYESITEKSSSITNYFVRKLFEKPQCLGLSNDYFSNYYIGHYKIFSWWYTLATKTTKDYVDNGVIETIEKYSYENEVKLAGLPSKITYYTGDETIETKYYYPPDQEMQNEPFRNQLVFGNMISNPLKTERFENGTKLSEQKIIYMQNYLTGGRLLPHFIYAAKFPNNLPSTPHGNLEKKVTYRYDNYGNIIQYQLEDGTPVALIWGFEKTKVVAKLENMYVDLIPTTLLDNITTSTQTQNKNTSFYQNAINDALEALKESSDTNLSNAMITTYKYNADMNIISVTDPKGQTIQYNYNTKKRLKNIRDDDNRLLSEFEYNFRN